MKRAFFLLLVFVLSSSVTATAQSWSPEETAVLDDMEACGDAWASAVEAGDYSTWADLCVASESASFMWQDGGIYSTRDWKRGITNKWFEPDEKWLLVTLLPSQITIDGNFAIVYYSPIYAHINEEGKRVPEKSQRRMEVLKKTDGKWKTLGGMGTLIDE